MDPVVDKDGNIYSKSAILKFIDANGKSPLTARRMFATELRPHNALNLRISNAIMARWNEQLRADHSGVGGWQGWQSMGAVNTNATANAAATALPPPSTIETAATVPSSSSFMHDRDRGAFVLAPRPLDGTAVALRSMSPLQYSAFTPSPVAGKGGLGRGAGAETEDSSSDASSGSGKARKWGLISQASDLVQLLGKRLFGVGKSDKHSSPPFSAPAFSNRNNHNLYRDHKTGLSHGLPMLNDADAASVSSTSASSTGEPEWFEKRPVLLIASTAEVDGKEKLRTKTVTRAAGGGRNEKTEMDNHINEDMDTTSVTSTIASTVASDVGGIMAKKKKVRKKREDSGHLTSSSLLSPSVPAASADAFNENERSPLLPVSQFINSGTRNARRRGGKGNVEEEDYDCDDEYVSINGPWTGCSSRKCKRAHVYVTSRCKRPRKGARN